MIEEYSSIMKNDVWEVIPRSTGKSVVTSRWLYKIKHVADGSVEKYKARFVARGFIQKEGIDYDETFALVARYTTIRTSVIRTGPEPAKPAGLTGSQGQPVRFLKKICKTGKKSKPASEPAGSVRNRPVQRQPYGRELGTTFF